MNFKHYLLAIATMTIFAVGCEKNEGEQTGDPKLTATPSELQFAASGSEMEKTITVTSNREWKIVEDLDAIGWIRATVDGKSIAGQKIPASSNPVIVTITVDDNTGFPKEQVLTFNGGTKAKATVTIKQDGSVSYNTIAEVIEMFEAQTADSLFLSDVMIKGTVISSTSQDNLASSKSLYIQDETAGINVFMDANHEFSFGDAVTFNLDGVPVIRYAGVPEITKCPLSAATKLSSGNVVEPVTIDVNDMTSGEYEARYVKIENVQVVESDLSKTWVVDKAATSINMESKTGGTFVVRSGKYSSYGSEQVAQGSGYICGICTTFNGAAQIIFAQDSDRKNMTGERFSSEKPDPSKAEPKTVSEFITLADGNKYYKLTGTVSGFNETYCSFDLTDNTGKIYVYSVDAASKEQYKAVIKNGGTVTLAGKYKFYASKSQHEVVDAVILKYEAGQSGKLETDKIADVIAAATGDTVILKNALVVAVAKTSYLVTDSEKSKYMLVFQKTEGADTRVALGDIVNVDAIKDVYNSMGQLKTPKTTVVSSGTQVVWPSAEDITDSFDTWTSSEVKYVSFTGELSKSGAYYNVAVIGATAKTGSILATDAVEPYVSIPNTKFNGFYLYSSGADGKYINIMFTEAAGSTDPYLILSPSGSTSVSSTATSQEIQVSSNVAWTAESDNTDFSLDVSEGEGNGTVVVTFPANTDTQNEQVAVITFSSEAGERTLTITQSAADDPSVEYKELTNAEIIASIGEGFGNSYTDITYKSESGDWPSHAVAAKGSDFIQINQKKSSYVQTPLFSKNIKKIEFTILGGKNVNETGESLERYIYAIPVGTSLPDGNYSTAIYETNYGFADTSGKAEDFTATLTMTGDQKQVLLVSKGGANYIKAIKVYFK